MMSDDMPWVNLSQEEIDDLRTQKYELTEYGRRKLRELREMSKFVKNPDEIILEKVNLVHYETMEKGRAVWIGIYTGDGHIYHLNIVGDNLLVNYSNETP